VHEVALIESIMAAIGERLGAEARIVRVRLEVGTLMAVLPEAMQFAFESCARGTAMEGARLEIDEVVARGRCRGCGVEAELDGVVALCGGCGGVDVDVVSGRELRICEVEVE